jgi:2-oxoglutarate dehydrogenase E1 component
MSKHRQEELMHVLSVLMRADHLESFLGSKFPAVKRFGVEGGEALLPGLYAMIFVSLPACLS